MQKKHLFVFALFLLFSTLQAQRVVVSESERLMSLGSRPAFHLDFSKADKGLVEKIWKDFAKEQFNGKLKKVKKSDEMSALGAESSIVSTDKFDLYSKIDESGDGRVSLDVWFDVGSYFLNRRDNPDRTQGVVDALTQFYYNVRRAEITKEQEKEEDKLKTVEKKLKNLQKDKANLQKDIEDYKAKIKKAEDDIVKNEQDQAKAQTDIDAQKRAVEEVIKRLNNVEKEN